MTALLIAAASVSCKEAPKPTPEPIRRVVATPIATARPTPPPTPRPTAQHSHAGLSAPAVVSRGDSETGGVIAQGIASYYDYPPCGSQGAAMLFYTWGEPYVRVVVSHAGRSVVATVCDNGPHVPGRVIDLSTALFRELCPSCDGLIPDVTVRRAA